MAETPRGGEFEFRFGSAGQGQGPSRRRGGDGEAMRILVMGSFSGGAAPEGLAGREVFEIDAERFDQVMARVGASVLDPLATPADALPIEFRSLEDLHPDRLVRRVEAFSKLRGIRERLRDRAKFEGAARDLVELLGFDPAPAGAGGGAAPAPSAPRTGAEEFAALLGEGAPRNVPPATRGGFDVESFVKGLVGQHAVKGSDGREAVYQAVVDSSLSVLMRRLMHTQALKELEAAWRGVHRLVTSLETGENLTVHLLDASRDEIIADLSAAARAGGLTKSGLYRHIVEASGLSGDGDGWGLIVGCYTFDRAVQDAVLLSGLAQLASAARAPLLSGTAPSLVGCASFADGADPDGWAFGRDAAAQAAGNAWELLRNSDDAKFVALGSPRVLLRLPYGPGGEETESFKFDELPAAPAGENASEDRERHEAYLWGNPAFALAEVMGNAFQSDGWEMDAGAADDVIGLPVHAFTEGPGGSGPKRVMACAEAWVTERGAHAIRQAGVTPIMSIKGRDGVRVAGVVSVHRSGEPPSGRWG